MLEKAGKVIAVELDTKMVKILNDRFTDYKNFEIINADILKLDLNEIIKINKEEKKFKNAKIVANLPYYITTPIIMMNSIVMWNMFIIASGMDLKFTILTLTLTGFVK